MADWSSDSQIDWNALVSHFAELRDRRRALVKDPDKHLFLQSYSNFRQDHLKQHPRLQDFPSFQDIRPSGQPIGLACWDVSVGPERTALTWAEAYREKASSQTESESDDVEQWLAQLAADGGLE